MLEVPKTGLAFVVFGNGNASPWTVEVPVICIFMGALFLITILMVAWALNRLWLGAAITSVAWLCAGLLTRPWVFFSDQSHSTLPGGEDDPVWKVLPVAWAISCLLCFAVTVAIFQHDRLLRQQANPRPRRHRRNRFRAGGRKADEEKYKTYEL